MTKQAYKIKQKILEYKYNQAKDIYIVGRWARYGVLPAKWSGLINDNGDPLIIHWDDHNGAYETYSLIPWYYATTGATIAYFFNYKAAENLVHLLNGNIA